MDKKNISKAIGIITTLLTLVGTNLLDLQYFPFKIIVSVAMGYCVTKCIILCSIVRAKKIFESEIKRNRKDKCKKLWLQVRQSKHSDDQVEKIVRFFEYYLNKDDIQINYNDFDEYYKKIVNDIKVAILVIVFFSIFNTNYVVNYAKELLNTFQNFIDEISVDVSEDIPEDVSEKISVDVSEDIPEDVSEKISVDVSEDISEDVSEEIVEESFIQNEWAKLILESPDAYPEINDDEFTNLYNLLFYINKDNLDKEIKDKSTILINSCETNNPLNLVTTMSGNASPYYSDIEAEILKGINNSSSRWDEIIKGREEILNKCPNGTISWLLANNYQTYALNYLDQTNESRSILYLYMKSIDYAQKSLEYDMDIENKLKRINYIKARYKDIGDCEILENDVRLRAYEICNAIDDVLYELDTDIPSSDEIKE